MMTSGKWKRPCIATARACTTQRLCISRWGSPARTANYSTRRSRISRQATGSRSRRRASTPRFSNRRSTGSSRFSARTCWNAGLPTADGERRQPDFHRRHAAYRFDTLVEQILATHSSIDATMELPFIGQYVREIAGREASIGPYPESVGRLAPVDFHVLAQRYLGCCHPVSRSSAVFSPTKRRKISCTSG